MTAFCGLDCEKCDAYVATTKNDDALRAATAEKWSKMFDAPLTAKDINCTGCRSDGVKLGYCEHMCEIRKCATGRGVETCADCDEYGCETLEGMLAHAPQARAALEALRTK